MSHDRRTHIVILGGGFGGLYAAMHLEKTLARDPNVEITLVNRENFFLFTPMLHEVAASDLDITHIVNPVHKLLRRVHFFAGEVGAIDLPARRKERGRVLVNEYMEVSEWPGVWTLGDCTLVPDRQTGTYYPPTAQHALRQGKVLAHNLTATVRGGQKKAFVFSTIGQLAAIGRRTGVANILGINFSGFIAWWLWRSIYLSKLPRFEKKVRVALDWTLDLIFSKDLVQSLTVRAPTISQGEDGRRPAIPVATMPEPANQRVRLYN
jgi:NADH dehydrogenase FAD-containing subunit